MAGTLADVLPRVWLLTIILFYLAISTKEPGDAGYPSEFKEEKPPFAV